MTNQSWRLLLIAASTVWLAGCRELAPDPRAVPPSSTPLGSHGSPIHSRARLDWIQVSPDHHGFEAASTHRPFRAWGFNYDRDYKMRLIEDYWDAEWPTVAQDFQEMKQLGANVVRVHLQFAKFMNSPSNANPHALARLRRLVKLAEKVGLHLDLTGLACYRKADVPQWYNRLGEKERWQAQAAFWEAIATTCAHSPAIFCFDLMNEPIVPSGKRPDGNWLTGELAGFTYCQFISLDQAGRPRAEIARDWITTLVGAIRQHDRRHMITVGLLPNSLEQPVSLSGFPPSKIAGPLDYVSVHLYPKSDHLDEALATLRGFNVGKPVVVEETFPLECSAKELRDFIERSEPWAAGWISFYWGRTPEDLAKEKGIGEALIREWLLVFQQLMKD